MIGITDWPTEIDVALITLCGVLASTLLGAGASFLNHRFLTKNVGKSNGRGTVVEMLEHLIERQARHEAHDDHRFSEVWGALHKLR